MPLFCMPFLQFCLLFFASVFALLAHSDLWGQGTFTNFADPSLSSENRLYVARSAMEFGLYENAAEIYSTLLSEVGAENSSFDLDGVRMLWVKALIGSREFLLASEVLQEVPEAKRNSLYYLYGMIVDYVLEYKRPKKAILNLLKGNLKRIDASSLDEADRVWFYYFSSAVDLIEGKKSALKDSLFQARLLASTNLEQQAYFQSLMLRLEYNLQKPDSTALKQLRKLLKENQDKPQSYHYAYDYAYLLALKGEKSQAIAAINSELSKGAVRYSNFELDNLRLLKVMVLGVDSIAGRDLLYTLMQSSEDSIILEFSFQLLKQYIFKTEDAAFLETLNAFFESEQSHPLRPQFYQLKVQFSLLAVERSRTASPSQEALQLLDQLKIDAEYLLENFPGSNALAEVYQMLVYVALYQAEPQYRLAADYLSKILALSGDAAVQLELNLLIGNCYFLKGDFEVAIEFYRSALDQRDRMDQATRGSLWFRMITAQLSSDRLEDALMESLREEAESGIIAPELFLKIQWNYALFLRSKGALGEAIAALKEASRFTAVSGRSIPTLLELRFTWMLLYLEHASGELTEEALAQSDVLLERLRSLEEGQISAEALSLLLSQVSLLKAQLLLSGEDFEDAFPVLNRLQKEFPDSQAAELSFIVLADHFSNSGQFDRAESSLLELAENYPESDFAPEALLEAALNAEKRYVDNFRQSIQLLNQLVNNYPNSPLVFFALRHQGDLLRKASDFSAALSVYNSLIQRFPDHPNRYLAELSRVDCLLALSYDQADYDFKELILELERLLDLPNLPPAFQLEVYYKLSFLFSETDRADLANTLIISMMDQYLKEGLEAERISSIEGYWMSRSLFLLGKQLEASDQSEASKKIYRKIIAYNLPGAELAKQLLLEY